ncbi:hypothetical protein [Luteithermobacter gelatinilyticus]|uniref:hypothetical protein n=1 Tax=Luteithermobacter gelatinilyticus TaxID=2582913 RepID=UPI001AEF655C|nr:hypothetical protein [Luteithermobacter gelatinilyticus]
MLLLLSGAASIAFVHTLLGPDHYLPFVAVGKARGWSVPKTGLVTLLCGLGHSVGSIVLGLIGVFAGRALADLVEIEAFRGDLAAWSLLAFGLVYFAWGMKKTVRGKKHTHWHTHADGTRHRHEHDHWTQHMHVHSSGEGAALQETKGLRALRMRIFAPWALFIVFVLGPCEPLIPLMMVPAAQGNIAGVMLTVAVFTAVTVLTMLVVVLLSSWGLRSVSFGGVEKYSHVIAGGTISLCAFGMLAFGL